MAKSSLSEREQLPPKINILTMFRLGLFQMGLGMMSVLTLAAGTIAMHQFVAPSRLWFGQMSDARKIWSNHRTGYIWIGAALFAIAAFLAVQVMWQLGSSIYNQGWSFVTYGWIALLAGIFALYGLALSSSSTPFAALLVDVSDEDDRSKLVGVVWSASCLHLSRVSHRNSIALQSTRSTCYPTKLD